MEWEEADNDLLDCNKSAAAAAAAALNLYSTRSNSHESHICYLSITNFQPDRHQHFITTHLETVQYSTKNRDPASDPRTRMVLHRLQVRAIFDDLNACIFTGKQANVYHATKHNGQEFAVKVFKDRDHDIQGDYRYGLKNCKRNPRKMAKTLEENETGNLLRLKAAGIRCPTPILLRLHVLVMEFIELLEVKFKKRILTGKSGLPAPCLKDANLSQDKMRECYVQMIIVMRKLYQKCKLVHGDLSEYNILYYEDNLHIIDVSQSVELDHPLAFKLLSGDCIHVSDFFRKNGVEVMPPRDLFDFVVDSSIPDESVVCYLEELDIPGFPGGQDGSGLPYIPTDQNQAPKQPNILDGDLSTKHTNNPGTDENEEVDDDDGDSSDSNGNGIEPYETMKEHAQKTPPADKKVARKENKKKVKEEKREARKTKTPKHVKKKKNKQSKNVKAR